MWQKLDTEGMVHKEFVHQERRWLENSIAKFWGDWFRNIQRKHPQKCRNNSWGLHNDNAPAHVSLVVLQFLASTNTTVIPHPP
jgi:hypothetical protein